MTLQPTDSTSIQAPPHQVSCTLYRQRKVKCDKQQPGYSNCVKAGVECVYAAHGRQRRHIGNGKSPEDVSRVELIHRVRLYEALFSKHGLQFEPEFQALDYVPRYTVGNDVSARNFQIPATVSGNQFSHAKSSDRVAPVGTSTGNSEASTKRKRVESNVIEGIFRVSTLLYNNLQTR
jgi:hypothetical protein